jgi:hypothetical protein
MLYAAIDLISSACTLMLRAVTRPVFPERVEGPGGLHPKANCLLILMGS